MTARTRRAPWLAVAVLVASLGLAGCAGVPRSSSPEVIESIPVGVLPSPSIRPEPGDSAREIVVKFLAANSVDPTQHSAALQFLTGKARNRWTDSSATIVADETVGTFQARHPQVVVTGRVVGTLASNGEYTPSRLRVGNGGPRTSFTYDVAKVHGQWRIDQPNKGLLLTAAQFQEAYHKRSLYFFDSANKYLVPDIRFSALGGTALDEWLISQLAAGPAPLLQNAVATDNLLSQSPAQRRFVHGGTPLRIEIPGASQLDPDARDRLAAQIAATLNDAIPGELFEITDSGSPVRIPAARDIQFGASTFSADLQPPSPAPHVFYLRRGHIVDSNGVQIPGPINNGRLGYLTSVAVSRPSPTSQLSFAGVAGNRLLVGTQSGGFVRTPVTGQLSRPIFMPGGDDVWIGVGARIYDVSGIAVTPAHPPRVRPVTVPSVGQDRRIVSLSISPEGSRVALVIQTPDGNDQLYIAAVVRNGGQLSIDLPDQPISPAGVSVVDAGWIEPLELSAIGYETRSHEPRIFSTNVDGSAWSNSPDGNLPPTPDAIAVSVDNVVWVSAHNTVWVQSVGEQWTSPRPSGQTAGYAPTYLS